MSMNISSARLVCLLKYLGVLGLTCSPRDARFGGSNPAEEDGFFSDCKNSEHKSSGRDFKLLNDLSKI